MSLACLECKRNGSFNTLIVKVGEDFDPQRPISHYPNYYTCCASFNSFREVKKSEYMVVEIISHASMWHTGNDGERFDEVKCRFISKNALKKLLPKIHKALASQ